MLKYWFYDVITLCFVPFFELHTTIDVGAFQLWQYFDDLAMQFVEDRTH